MDTADQVMELQVFQSQGPGPHKLLLEYLKNRHYAAFKSLATKSLKKNPPSIDMDHVYPYPLDKTLLDIACSNGLDDFVELILNLGANPNKENVVHQRSPLHFAAEAGHAGVLKILLSNPAIKPNLEVARQTALHIAVNKRNVECVEVLLEYNASPNIANSKGLTPTHLAAASRQEAVIDLIFSKSKCPPDIDSFKDFRRRTTRQILEQELPHISLPPVIDRKMDVTDLKYFLDCNDEESYLQHAENVELTHEEMIDLLKIAVRQNLPGVVKSLAKNEIVGDRGILAEAAENAVVRGHYKVLKELFDAGAERSGNLLIKGCQELGSHAVRGSDRMACLRLILAKPVNVRDVDEKGNTALHYAARAESSEIISELLKSGSYIGHQNDLGIPPIANISPESMSRYLDDCLQTTKEHTDDYEDYEIEFNYQCLAPHGFIRNQDSEHLLEKGHVNYKRICMEMQPFLYIANSNSHRHLLKHPILSSFLYLKWQRISPILYANFIFYVIFYLIFNAYILSMTFSSGDPEKETESTSYNGNDTESDISLAKWQQNGTLWTFTAIALMILILRELLQLVSSPWNYFFSSENWLELLLVCLGVALLGGPEPCTGAIAILLSAWELVILIGQHPRMSTAIEMFKTVTLNFMHFLFLYAFLILAFAFAFYTLFKDQSDFLDPGHSLFKTIIMLTGEFDASDIPFIAHPVLSRLVFVLFVFLIAIVLFNLLNGLAVSDTAEILGKAELVGLISRVKLVSYAEGIVVGSPVLKNRWCCHYGEFVQRMRINPLRFMSKKILFFPDFLPEAKIRVKPLRGNTVIPHGKTVYRNTCSKLTLDRHIIEQAKEIILSRGRISDYEKIINVFNQKFERLEAMLQSLNLAVKENTCNTNETD
ncbi:transient receptor potential cation channel protein painless [Neodiprion virginianus]|uniref:transient receptor potential cation channel protein painless n=1 Tax=Neodiprion virginianus TaxID=2961670 RepID=UPI001EE7738F|nr:transient receptor potential cation channel protein painless [Neodiprion virginianus]